MICLFVTKLCGMRPGADVSLLKFDNSKVSDQKRLVRGEHYLLARHILRARDAKHNMKWRVMTMAGGSPSGEMVAIRELMPKASVVAVDNDERCLEAAIEAGADDVLCCDVLAVEKLPDSVSYKPPSAVVSAGRFDILNLDLCGGINPAMKQAVSIYLRQMVTPGGVFMVTFSYGRDVAELFMNLGRSYECLISATLRQYETKQLPEELSQGVAGRIRYLCSDSLLSWLRSVAVYRGAEMPMCSLLFQSGRVNHGKLSVLNVEKGDFELAVVYPEAANLYDCPQERIETLRRKFGAIKAVLTRQKSSLFGA